MHVGLALWTMQSTAAAPANHALLYRRLVDDARRAEEMGFDSLWLAEHRFWYDGWCPAPLVAAAAATAATRRLRVGTAMLLLPQHDPLRVAEAVATLDRLSGGRVDLGVGLGYRDAEFDGLGIRRSDRGARMEEALDVLLAAWGDGPFSFAGRHFRYAERDVHPKPVQRPHPPIFLGGLAEKALARGARRGLSFLLPQTLRLDEIAAAADRIRREAAAAGRAPGRIGVLKDAWVADDGRAARQFFLPRIEAHYREEAGAWWVLKGKHAGFERPDLLDAQLERTRETALVGSPDEVAAQLKAIVEAGVELVALRFHFDVIPRQAFEDAAELFAREVLPFVRGRP